ncbi:hypothetical protein VKT23_014107 [Stygiomarasmius scandens]|uniref:Uncharacterized protein n=1 Tax=Marasmiellus scandens TaxID=2682957 RepID=A0ABR1J1B1_9AGAR
MTTPSFNNIVDINSFLAELSQIDTAKSSGPISYFSIVITFGILSVMMLFRLRYPCVTVAALDNFVGVLKDKVEVTCRKEKVPTDGFNCQLDGIEEQLSDIKIDDNGNIFRWSTSHSYIVSFFKTLHNVIACYESAQELHVSVSNAIEYKRRARYRFEQQAQASSTQYQGHNGICATGVDNRRTLIYPPPSRGIHGRSHFGTQDV